MSLKLSLTLGSLESCRHEPAVLQRGGLDVPERAEEEHLEGLREHEAEVVFDLHSQYSVPVDPFVRREVVANAVDPQVDFPQLELRFVLRVLSAVVKLDFVKRVEMSSVLLTDERDK